MYIYMYICTWASRTLLDGYVVPTGPEGPSTHIWVPGFLAREGATASRYSWSCHLAEQTRIPTARYGPCIAPGHCNNRNRMQLALLQHICTPILRKDKAGRSLSLKGCIGGA